MSCAALLSHRIVNRDIATSCSVGVDASPRGIRVQEWEGVKLSPFQRGHSPLSIWWLTKASYHKSGWVGWQRDGGICHQNCPRDREREKETEAWRQPGFLQGETDYITGYVFWNLKKNKGQFTNLRLSRQWYQKSAEWCVLPHFVPCISFFRDSLFHRTWVSEESLEIICLNQVPHAEISFMTLTTDGQPLPCGFCYNLFSSVIGFYRTPLS